MTSIPAIAAFLLLAPMAHAQSIGTVAITDADVAATPGTPLQLTSTRATLTSPATVTALTRTAEIALTRGGSLRVCRSTPLHLSQTPAQALFLSLDRGALELRFKATPADTLLTPDLRLTPLAPGPLDLEIRVAHNGDTCIDNRGRHAPAVQVTDAFGQSAYLLKPGQHVLFEHGSLREVVDRETISCGCPPGDKPGVPLAEALVRGGASPTPQQAAAAHPFPVAQSEGLAPAPAVIPAPPGQNQTQTEIADTLTFDSTKAPPATPPVTLPLAAPPPPPKANPARALGRFFKRLFVR